MTKKGRTSRKRQHKSKTNRPQDVSLDKEFVEFAKWMMHNGYRKAVTLVPAEFQGTGRGLMTKENISTEKLLISIPEKLLITTQTVFSSYLGPILERSLPKFTALQALCLYLMCEKAKGKDSFWYPYFQILPQSYSNALYWTSDEISLLSRQLQESISEQLQCAKQLHEQTVVLFNKFTHLEVSSSIGKESDWTAFRWAWSTINTRSVYMQQELNMYLDQTGKDSYALAPYLDLLNHDPCAQIDAAFNENTRCYEITTRSRYQKFNQVFICYGPHSNEKLMIEYGFIAQMNPHNIISFTVDDILQAASSCGIQLHHDYRKYLDKYNLTQGLSCSEDGLSWNLRLILSILSMTENINDRIRQMLMQGQLTLSDQEKAKFHRFTSYLISTKRLEFEDNLKKIGEPTTYHKDMIMKTKREKIKLLDVALHSSV